MSRRFVRGAWLALLPLVACRNEDAYLGGSQEAYRCQTRCELEQGAPADAGDWFFNPETELGAAPTIVYPLDGAMHPRDLRQLTVQFRRGRSDFRVFRVRIEALGSGIAYDFFTPCLAVDDDGCRYVLNGGVWDNARAELVGKPAVLTVTGATALQGLLKASAPVSLGIVEGNLENKGFYYWTTVTDFIDDRSTAGIYRLPFGADQAEPFIMPNTSTNTRQCGACHSVSRDGSTIAFTARDIEGGPVDQRSGSLVAALTAQPQVHVIEAATPGTYDSSMMALSTNGKRVLVAYDEQLVLRSSEPNGAGPGGAVIASLSKADLGGKIGYFPEFAPSDDAVVLTLTLPDQIDSAIAVRAGDIAVIAVDLANGTFGPPRTLVPDTGDFHFYPTWSPNGDYIAFASAPHGTGDDGNPRKSYDQKQARLRLVRVEDGAVFELANATHEEGKWSTYPKFAPFTSGSGLSFLTFNSKIDYGFIQDNSAKPDAQKVAQLWMSAVDTTKLPADPSSPPIWLPFQDPTQPGHLGLWTKDVKCRTDVGGSPCAFGQVCTGDVCVVRPK